MGPRPCSTAVNGLYQSRRRDDARRDATEARDDGRERAGPQNFPQARRGGAGAIAATCAASGATAADDPAWMKNPGAPLGSYGAPAAYEGKVTHDDNFIIMFPARAGR